MTTKYSIGDKVWCMYLNNPTKLKVFNIRICENKSIFYMLVDDYEDLYILSEDKLFPTKRDLLDSFLTEEDKL